jgi:hypothetical protein
VSVTVQQDAVVGIGGQSPNDDWLRGKYGPVRARDRTTVGTFFNGAYVLAGTSQMLKVTVWAPLHRRDRELWVHLWWDDPGEMTVDMGSAARDECVHLAISNLHVLCPRNDSRKSDVTEATFSWIGRVLAALPLTGVTGVTTEDDRCVCFWGQSGSLFEKLALRSADNG